MKKAKKLLAVILAMVMLASAACLPVYAKRLADNTGTPDRMTSNQKYYFGAEKGASYLLDMLDDMLKEAYIYMTWDHLAGDVGGWLVENLLSMPPVDLTSIDNAIDTVYTIIDEFDSGLDSALASLATGDLLDYLNKTGLDPNVKRGTRESDYNGGSSDMKVLFNLLQWLNNNKQVFVKLIAGTLDFGLLDGTIKGLKIAGMPILEDVDKYVPVLLYQMLVDDTVTEMPAGETIETGLQKVINWALVTGTGEAAENGGYSLLGANTKPLLGEGVFTAEQVNISTNSVYQFVNNLINGLLNGFLAPELSGIIADLVGIEEDGSVDDMTMFNTIVGVIEGLLTDNGADDPVYTEAENARTPMGMIDDLVRWLLKGNPVTGSDGSVTYVNPALYTFIKIDVTGIGITDNFMSLLNDLIRIAINLLPLLGLEIPEGVMPSSDALSEVNYYKIVVDEATGVESKVLCDKSDEAKEDQLYRTYKNKLQCYAVYDDEGKIDHYNYFGGQELPVNTGDSTASDYENPDFIRPDYVMAMDQVWAAVVKAVFTMVVEGPYFPEWATTMDAVLAYGCAGLAAPIIPEGDWYDRLDAYHLSGNNTADYEIRTGKVVTPLAYSNQAARSTTSLPTGAMEILSGVGAYYLNTMLDLTANQRFTTVNTSFEQLLTELALWAMTTYLPILSGELDTTTGLVHTAEYTGTFDETRYPGTYAAETNTLINYCYTNFASRTVKDDPQWSAIYEYLDATILSLIPAGWLPAEFYDSQSLFNDWLFGNLMEFDLQGLLSILSANETGELNEPLLTVLLRVIDRVLAIVFGSEALMLPTDRSGTGTNSVFARNTDITTLTALLEDGDGANEAASLPELVNRLFTLLNKHKGLLFCTLLPLLKGGSFERPFDQDALNMDDSFVNVLGTDMTKYTISDLENQIRTLTNNVNAIQINKAVHMSTSPYVYGEYDNEAAATEAQTALGAEFGNTEIIANDDGTSTYVVYKNNTNADDILALYKSQYGEDADIYVETIERIAETSTQTAVYEFNVYQSKSYFDSATATTATDDAGTYEVFSGFNYKSINHSSATNPLVTWDDGAYYFWASEDSNPNAYFYANYKDAVTDAETFVDSYESFVESTLPDAFGAWLEYSIDGFAVAADVYDANGDGKSILSTSDSDYVADNADTTDVNEETPVDGFPSAPEAMYPYYVESDGTVVTWVDEEIDDYISQTRDSFTKANYELLAMAETYGNDPANKVLLDKFYTEKTVRFVLWSGNGNDSAAAMQFDITADANGNYTGSRQWEDLTEAEITNIKSTCEGYHMFFEKNAETGEYEIYRKAYAPITSSNFDFQKAPDGATTLSVTPPSARNYVGDAGPSDYQVAQNAIYDGYVEYIDTLYSMRRSLYNQLDTLNWRIEMAEDNRATSLDTTMLDWALAHFRSAYISVDNKRNEVYVSTVDGVDQYTKVYTSSSYEAFRRAYDYANSLSKTGIGQASGVTQSMVTMAYQKLIEAYNALVKYLGDADWVQYIEYLTLAKEISKTVSEGGFADDPELGLTEQSRTDLANIINEAVNFAGDIGTTGDEYRKQNFDCENQEDIDAMAASINSVILNLKYLSNPDLKVNEGLKVPTGSEVDAAGNVHNYGWIIGLKEGEGLVLDKVTEVGMLINETKGDYLALEESIKGVGTGARIDGYINGMSRFRYYGVLYGDLNGDARVDGTDWAKLSYYLLTGGTGITETHLLEAADVDHKGGITIADANYIKEHYNYTYTINQAASSTGTETTGL